MDICTEAGGYATQKTDNFPVTSAASLASIALINHSFTNGLFVTVIGLFSNLRPAPITPNSKEELSRNHLSDGRLPHHR